MSTICITSFEPEAPPSIETDIESITCRFTLKADESDARAVCPKIDNTTPHSSKNKISILFDHAVIAGNLIVYSSIVTSLTLKKAWQ